MMVSCFIFLKVSHPLLFFANVIFPLEPSPSPDDKPDDDSSLWNSYVTNSIDGENIALVMRM